MMSTRIPKTISREEFDRRLNESNERRRNELQQKDEEQTQIEELLVRYEHTLDEIEASLNAEGEASSAATLLRKRLQDLARKTAEVAALL